jgi:tetratricopeptide (TPR) repeat protein
MSAGSDLTWIQGVRALLQQGDYSEAVALTERALAEPGNETNGRLTQLHGLTLYVNGDCEAALAEFESALLLSPLTSESFLALADLYIKNDQHEDARVSLNILVEEVDTVPPELFPRIAGLLGCVGETRKALFICYRVIDNDPDRDEAIFAAAHYMRKLGYAPKPVIGMMRRAVSLAPDNCTYRRSLAAALTMSGDIEGAYSLFTSLSSKEVCCKSCLQLMIDVFEKFGDWERLRDCQKRLLEIDSTAH